MLKSAIGSLLYRLLPNHIVWKRLNDEEKQLVFDACSIHNNAHYANPGQYDTEHKRSEDVLATYEGRILKESLREFKPQTVLEVGPGTGYYLPIVLGQDSVVSYLGIDIVKPFLQYIEKNVVNQYPGKKIVLHYGTIFDCDVKEKYNLILFVSALHHIPNRADVIKKCSEMLSDGGRILIIEPRHGIPRVVQIIYKFIREYHKESHWKNKINYSTHHSICLSEVKALSRIPHLMIEDMKFFCYKGDRFFREICKTKYGGLFLKYIPIIHLFSRQIFVVYKKV